MKELIAFFEELKSICNRTEEYTDGKDYPIMGVLKTFYINSSIVRRDFIEHLKDLDILDLDVSGANYKYKWSDPRLTGRDAANLYWTKNDVREVKASYNGYYFAMRKTTTLKLKYHHESDNYLYFKVVNNKDYSPLFRAYKFYLPGKCRVEEWKPVSK